jgi:ATP adenylyltransferase
MIVSNRHIDSLEKLSDDEVLDMNKSLIRIKSILKKALGPQGFNIGMNIGKCAGAGVDKHLHIHLVPRWLGDTNFMPVTGDTKIISQSLGELYTKITLCLRVKK